MANAEEILSEIHKSLVGLDVRISIYFRDSPKARCALVIISALLIGVIETLLALGLSVPILSVIVGVISALFVAVLLAFLEDTLMKSDKSNHAFMQNLMIICGLFAGAVLGVFIVTVVPSVLNILTIKTVSGVVSAILPYVFAGLITLAVTGIVGYALYRAMGVGSWQAGVRNPWDVLSRVNLKSLPEAKEKKEAESFILLQKVQKSCFANLEEGKIADYSPAFQSFGAMLTGLQSNSSERADDQLVSELKWQQQLVQICGNSSDQELQSELLSEVAAGISSHYSTSSLIFAANLTAVQDTRSQESNRKALTADALKIAEQYKKLFSYIQKGDKRGALAVLHALNPDPEVPRWRPFKKPKASLSSRPPPLPAKRKNRSRAQKKSVNSQV